MKFRTEEQERNCELAEQNEKPLENEETKIRSEFSDLFCGGGTTKFHHRSRKKEWGSNVKTEMQRKWRSQARERNRLFVPKIDSGKRITKHTRGKKRAERGRDLKRNEKLETRTNHGSRTLSENKNQSEEIMDQGLWIKKPG